MTRRASFTWPCGTVVLQFAWGGDGRNPHLPHNHYENSFCYPGTHDNETSQGWYDNQVGRRRLTPGWEQLTRRLLSTLETIL